jgi:hypothetical protein
MNFDVAALTGQLRELNAHLAQIETFIPWALAALGAIALGLWVNGRK